MQRDNTEIFLQYAVEYGGYSLALSRKTEDGKRYVYDVQITEREYKPGEHFRPTAILGKHQAQQLMDELWPLT